MSIELFEATPYFSRFFALLVFALSLSSKLCSPALFRNTVASFKLLPDRISSFVTYTPIVIEGLIVLALILGKNFCSQLWRQQPLRTASIHLHLKVDLTDG